MTQFYKVIFHEAGTGKEVDYMVNDYTRKEALKCVDDLNEHAPYTNGYFKIKVKR